MERAAIDAWMEGDSAAISGVGVAWIWDTNLPSGRKWEEGVPQRRADVLASWTEGRKRSLSWVLKAAALRRSWASAFSAGTASGLALLPDVAIIGKLAECKCDNAEALSCRRCCALGDFCIVAAARALDMASRAEDASGEVRRMMLAAEAVPDLIKLSYGRICALHGILESLCGKAPEFEAAGAMGEDAWREAIALLRRTYGECKIYIPGVDCASAERILESRREMRMLSRASVAGAMSATLRL